MELDILLIVSLIFIFVTGACIGSFLNVVALRALSNESIVLPPSKCPKCQNALKWYDNIPIISYILLKGKCRFCGEKISIQYPLVEFFTALVFVFVFMYYGTTLQALLLLILISLAIIISITDIKEKYVYDKHSYTFIVIAIIYALTKGEIMPTLINSLLGLLVGAVIMEVLARLGYVLVKKRAFGEGDTVIAAGIGAMLGWFPVLLAIVASIVIQAACILPSFIKGLITTKQYRLLISLSAFIPLAIIYKVCSKIFNLNIFIILISTLILMFLGIYICTLITKMTKSETSITYIPFGPSLLLASFLILFCGKPIIELMKYIW